MARWCARSNIETEGGVFRIREEMERKHCELAAIEIINKKLSAHVGKYDGIFARLCLLWHCIENPHTEPPLQISAACTRRVAESGRTTSKKFRCRC